VTRVWGKGLDEDPARRAGGSGWVALWLPARGVTTTVCAAPGALWAISQCGADGVR
jgi:hypothetical protein